MKDHGYADDTQMCKHFYFRGTDRLQSAVQMLEVCLADVSAWMLMNKLKFNRAKTEFMVTAS